MPDWRTVVQSKHLCAADLQGHDVTVVIDRLVATQIEDFKDAKKMVAVFEVFFRGKKKSAIFKAKNLKVVTKLTGTRITEKWVGVAITLYPTTEKIYGEMQEVIRVRPNRPDAATAKEAETRVDPVTPTDLTDDDKRAIAAAEAAEAAARG